MSGASDISREPERPWPGQPSEEKASQGSSTASSNGMVKAKYKTLKHLHKEQEDNRHKLLHGEF